MERICKNCGRKYTAPPAISRKDGSEICPICGYREALDAAGVEGEEILAELTAKYVEMGLISASL